MNNLTLSFELISFLKWLLENKKGDLEQLVRQSVRNGYLKFEFQSQANGSDAHEVIKAFVTFCEKTLKDAIADSDFLEAKLKEQLSELADSFDLLLFDDLAILQGFKQAKSQIAKSEIAEKDYDLNNSFFKTVLITKILENWQPTNTAAEG
jgi:hypothetical protein